MDEKLGAREADACDSMENRWLIGSIRYPVIQANAEINLDELLVKGDYTLTSLFTKASGPFTVTLKNVVVKGNATLGVERDGQIRTQNIIMDMGFSDMSMDFENLGNATSINKTY